MNLREGDHFHNEEARKGYFVSEFEELEHIQERVIQQRQEYLRQQENDKEIDAVDKGGLHERPRKHVAESV